MAEAMADNGRQNAPQNFLGMSVSDCFLSELVNIGFGLIRYRHMRIPNITVHMSALVVAALLIATGCSKQKPLVLIEPNTGVDKVQKGMNKQQVEAALGKPKKIIDKWWYYLDRGMIVAFGDNGVMFNIKCVSPFAGITKEGIGIGSTRAELLTAYGNPSQEKQFQGSGSGAVVSTSAGFGGGETFDNLWFASLGISF